MERSCEFCGVARAVIYCQSDAAFLCLSCDSKVHSANALSGRHYRDLLCDSCRDNTAYVRCIDHSMLLCRRCDSQLHDLFSHHKKLMLKSFTGCPSAQHFASLWGFNDQVGSESGRTSGQHKENNSLVLQQILNLKKLQVTESDKQSFPNFNSSANAPFKEHGSFNRNLRSSENPSHALENEGFTLPISQLDHLSNSSLGGDLGSSQFWSQNLQDLGVCEDLGHFDDDLKIPEVDLSFRNFEELFASDVNVAHPLLKDSDLIWSQVTKAVLIDESENSHVNTTEVVAAASSISFNNGITFKEKTHISDNVALGTFRTMEELSQSFLSAESSGSDCLDSGHSEFVDSSRQM